MHTKFKPEVYVLSKEEGVRHTPFFTNYLLFFFNDTANTEIYTLSLHDALPISIASSPWRSAASPAAWVSDDTWYGRRTRFTSPATSGDTSPYPRRAPASANALENVRSTATFSKEPATADVLPPNSMYASSTTTSAPEDASCSTVSTGCAFPVGLFGEHRNTTWGSAASARSTCDGVMAKGASTGTWTTSVWATQDSREYSGYVGSKVTARRPGPP